MSRGSQIGAQLSPDGRWQWDGNRWLPVAPPLRAAPLAGSAAGRGSAWIVVLAAALVGALVVGVVAGAVAGGLANRQQAAHPAAFPSAFPSRGDRYLRSVTMTGLKQDISSSYNCSSVPQLPDSRFKHLLSCDFNGDTPTNPAIDIYYDQDTGVGEVDASCERPFGAPISACASVDGAVARMVFPQGSPLGSQAQAWAEQKLGSGSSTLIGSVYLFMPTMNSDLLPMHAMPAG